MDEGWEDVINELENRKEKSKDKNENDNDNDNDSIMLLAFNINKMTLHLNRLTTEIENFRKVNYQQNRLSNLQFALLNAELNAFYYYKSIDEIYLMKERVSSAILIREIVQVFIQGHGYSIQGYYIDENKENTIRTSIPYYSTQRQLLSLMKKANTSSLAVEAQNEFIENISNQLHILTGTYPKVDIIVDKVLHREEIVIWEN